MVHKLHKDPQSLHEIVRLIDLEDVVLDFCHVHESNLIVDQNSFFLASDLDVLHGENHSISLSLDFEYLRLSTCSETTDDPIVWIRVVLSEVSIFLKIGLELFRRWNLVGFFLLFLFDLNRHEVN